MLEVNWDESITHDQVVDFITHGLNMNESRIGVVWESDTPLPPRSRGIQFGDRVLRPDVLGVEQLANSTVGFIEIETASTVFSDLTQWLDYDSAAEAHDCQFAIVVPEGYGLAASLLSSGLHRLAAIYTYSASPDGRIAIEKFS